MILQENKKKIFFLSFFSSPWYFIHEDYQNSFIQDKDTQNPEFYYIYLIQILIFL